MLSIKNYRETDWGQLLELIQREGDEWSDYTSEATRDAYSEAVRDSETFIAFEENQLVGFCRCRVDGIFGVYIYDLLVDQPHRGRKIAQQLMEHVCSSFSEQIVYVMSDVDDFYAGKGYRKEGSIFEVKIAE